MFQKCIIIFKFHTYQNVGIKSANIAKCKVFNKLFCRFVENIQNYFWNSLSPTVLNFSSTIVTRKPAIFCIVHRVRRIILHLYILVQINSLKGVQFLSRNFLFCFSVSLIKYWGNTLFYSVCLKLTLTQIQLII